MTFCVRLTGLLFFFSLFSLGSYAASVFKVTNGENVTYIGGTLHILSEDDYPLPPEYSQAFEQSDTLVFETDLEELESPEFSKAMMASLTYNNGRTLADDLSPETFEKLSTHLQSRGLSISRFISFKPSLMSITLSMIELQMMGLTEEGVDKYLFNQAQAANKPIKWLETPQQQLSFIAHMGNGNEDEFIQYTLDDIKTLHDALPALKESWKTGDLAGLYNESLSDFAVQYPDVFDALLTTRNQNWMDFLINSLSTSETEFILVGALHLPGDTGILHLLEQQGYSVKKL